MATHSGFTAGGKHFTETLTTRMGNPLVTYHVDGKRVTERAWFAEVKAAQHADRIKKLAAASIAAGLADLAALHESYTAELDAADEADAIAAKMFARA